MVYMDLLKMWWKRLREAQPSVFYLPIKKKVARAIAGFYVARLLDLFDVS